MWHLKGASQGLCDRPRDASRLASALLVHRRGEQRALAARGSAGDAGRGELEAGEVDKAVFNKDTTRFIWSPMEEGSARRDAPHNFIELIAAGRATAGLADPLAQAEAQVKALSEDVTSLESARGDTFAAPSRAWIAERIAGLTGAITLTPRRPEVGRPCMVAACKVHSLEFLAEPGSNSFQWWRRRESNPGPKISASLILRAHPILCIAVGVAYRHATHTARDLFAPRLSPGHPMISQPIQ